MKQRLDPNLRHGTDVPVKGVIPVEDIEEDDEDNKVLLTKMSKDAEAYLRSFSWCGDVLNSFFGAGVGGVFAVFLFKVRPTSHHVSSWIWIVVGDVPSAYLPIEDAKSPAEVFKVYMAGMTKWVEMAKRGRTGTFDDGVPPVNVPATPEWAGQIERRLHSLILIVKPFFEENDEFTQLN